MKGPVALESVLAHRPGPCPGAEISLETGARGVPPRLSLEYADRTSARRSDLPVNSSSQYKVDSEHHPSALTSHPGQFVPVAQSGKRVVDTVPASVEDVPDACGAVVLQEIVKIVGAFSVSFQESIYVGRLLRSQAERLLRDAASFFLVGLYEYSVGVDGHVVVEVSVEKLEQEVRLLEVIGSVIVYVVGAVCGVFDPESRMPEGGGGVLAGSTCQQGDVQRVLSLCSQGQDGHQKDEYNPFHNN